MDNILDHVESLPSKVRHKWLEYRRKIKRAIYVIIIFIIVRINSPHYTQNRSYKSYKLKHQRLGHKMGQILGDGFSHGDEILDSLVDDDENFNRKEGVADGSDDLDPAIAAEKFKKEEEEKRKKEEMEEEIEKIKQLDVSEEEKRKLITILKAPPDYEHDAKAKALQDYEASLQADGEGFAMQHINHEENDYGDFSVSLTESPKIETELSEKEKQINYNGLMSSRQLEYRMRQGFNEQDKEYISRLLGLKQNYQRAPQRTKSIEEIAVV